MTDLLKIKENHVLSGLGIIILMFMITSCGSNSSMSSEGRQDFQELRERVKNREFEIQNQWAMPLSGSNINLIGNPNFIRFQNDSVNLFLPYFGVRHSGGGYNRDGGIRYEGPVEELEIEENVNKKHIRLLFEGQQNNENLDFRITVYPNGSAHTVVTSSQRSTISYRGEIGDLPEKRN